MFFLFLQNSFDFDFFLIFLLQQPIRTKSTIHRWCITAGRVAVSWQVRDSVFLPQTHDGFDWKFLDTFKTTKNKNLEIIAKKWNDEWALLSAAVAFTSF